CTEGQTSLREDQAPQARRVLVPAARERLEFDQEGIQGRIGIGVLALLLVQRVDNPPDLRPAAGAARLLRLILPGRRPGTAGECQEQEESCSQHAALQIQMPQAAASAVCRHWCSWLVSSSW